MLDYRKILAENVKAARKALGLSQEALAFETEIDRTYISGIERGKRNPSLSLIARLAERLGTTPGALLLPRGKKIAVEARCILAAKSTYASTL